MSLKEGVVESDGVAIHYLDWGGDGPPLLLIHATGFLGALWRPIAERLTGRFRVVAFDQRGHGESGKPADGYTFEAFAKAVRKAGVTRAVRSRLLEKRSEPDYQARQDVENQRLHLLARERREVVPTKRTPKTKARAAAPARRRVRSR